jgi:hypothetical protein
VKTVFAGPDTFVQSARHARAQSKAQEFVIQLLSAVCIGESVECQPNADPSCTNANTKALEVFVQTMHGVLTRSQALEV